MSYLLLRGDARRLPLADESVQCVVTSPPYWGLRKYAGKQESVWGGREDCEHEWNDWTIRGDCRVQPVDFNARWTGTERKHREIPSWSAVQGTCQKCGAWRGAYGLEPTVEMYVQHTVETFREIRRVLRYDGCCFLSLGDSYASRNMRDAPQTYPIRDAAGQSDVLDVLHGGLQIGLPAQSSQSAARNGTRSEKIREEQKGNSASGIKAKDLCLIPARIAIALQNDGWWVRSDIIWSKTNPMPESVRDRPTDAYEHILLLAKGEWKSGIIEFANFPDERVQFGQYLGLEEPSAGHALTKFCILLASSLFYGCQLENDLSLPPLYAEEWQQAPDGCDPGFAASLPIAHRPALQAARFLASRSTAKEFVCQLNCLGVALADDNKSVMDTAPLSALALSSVHRNGDGTVTVHDSGEIGEFDFIHGIIVHRKPSKCSYYWDASAVAEELATKPHAPGNKRRLGVLIQGEQRLEKRGASPDPALDPSRIWARNGKRNLRNVWTFSTQPYKGAHFATFPEKLPRRCILAASRPGDLVLDPFSGSGTTGKVAVELGRKYIGLDLAYHELAKERIGKGVLPVVSTEELSDSGE